MKKTFIHIVAKDILEKYGTNLSNITVVFPNKRAALFFNKALTELSDKPVWCPSYISINELFIQQSKYTIADEIKLICELYKSYIKCTCSTETLDEFYNWGQMMLADFDDVDKNLADAKMVFNNIGNLHEFDSVDYLTDNQKEALKQFFSTFNDDHNSKLQERFLKFWNNLYNIYIDFNTRLKNQGLTYEGALYREVTEKKDINISSSNYFFVGFNLLHKSEKAILKYFQHEGKAKFYWDFDFYYNNVSSEAGRFINQNLQEFTNELDCNDDQIYNQFTKQKDITFISTTTENTQARYINQWLTDDRINDGSQTAIVLCDESLLQTVIHSLPEKANDINITTGYPLSQTPIASLLEILINLQTIGIVSSSDKYRLKYINQVLRHPYANLISYNASELFEDLNSKNRYFPTRKELSKDEHLSILFSELNGQNFNLSLNQWLLSLVTKIAISGKSQQQNNPLFQESLFRTYKLLNRLHTLIESGDLAVDTTTYKRLLRQIINSTSIPFHGEPVKGVQIMGVLETRNLDFKHILLLSCNEGNMPRGINDNSFIPHSIRQSFSLTTVDNKVAIYAYYFYRLIQRAEDITILYNNSNISGSVKEMSRFMLQLMVESSHKIKQKCFSTKIIPLTELPKPILKDDVIITKLKSIEKIYPTELNQYLRCQKIFFYKKLANLRELDDTDEATIDNRHFGNIFHSASQILYDELSKNRIITQSCIEQILNNPMKIESAVDKAFKKELFKQKEDSTLRPEYSGLQLINRKVVIYYLKQLLRIDKTLAPFSILGLEKKVSLPMSFKTAFGEIKLDICGIIDRLDKITTQETQGQSEIIRVVDYKTGNKEPESINNIDDVFDTNKIDHHSDYYLQTMLYSIIVSRNEQTALPVSPALLFIQHTSSTDYDPTLKLKKDKILDIKQYEGDFLSHLQELIAEIFNPDLPFSPTENTDHCKTCPYAEICKR